MKLEGDYTFNGPREEVWEMVRDPEVLASALPGTKSLDQVDTEINIESDTRVPSKVLHEITAEYRNRELSLEDMTSVAELVTIAYQEKGYLLAQAYVPEQEIEDGILKIAISEGDVGDVKITGQKYYDERVIRRNFLEQLRHGVVREELLEKGLLLSKELPSAETRIVLEQGEEQGRCLWNAHGSKDVHGGGIACSESTGGQGDGAYGVDDRYEREIVDEPDVYFQGKAEEEAGNHESGMI